MWADGTPNDEIEVESQIDEMISDLSDTTTTTSGTRKMGVEATTVGSLAFTAGTLYDRLVDIQTELESLQSAANINYAGGGPWADGTANPATSVEAQLDKIVVDLASTLSSSGTDKIGGETLTSTISGGNNLAAGTLTSQLQDIINNSVSLGSSPVLTGTVWQFTTANTTFRFTNTNTTLQFNGGGVPQISANGGVDFYLTLDTTPDIRFVVRKDNGDEHLVVDMPSDQVEVTSRNDRFVLSCPTRIRDAGSLYAENDGSIGDNAVWLGYDRNDIEATSGEMRHRLGGAMLSWHHLRWDFFEHSTLSHYSGLAAGGAGSTTITATSSSSRGSMQLATTTTVGQFAQAEATLVAYDRNDGAAIFEYIIETRGATTGQIHEYGFMNIGGVSIEDNVTGVMVVYDTDQGDTTWHLVGASGGATTRSDSGVAFTGNTRYRFTVRVETDGSAELWIDGVSVATLGTAVVGTNVMWWQSRLETRNTTQNIVEIDRFEFWIEPLDV